MRNWGKFWAKIQKRPKHPTATSKELGAKIVCQEQKQGTAHAPCTQHHKEVGKTLKPLSCLTPGHTPTLTPYKEPAHPVSGVSQGTCYLFLLPPATTEHQ